MSGWPSGPLKPRKPGESTRAGCGVVAGLAGGGVALARAVLQVAEPALLVELGDRREVVGAAGAVPVALASLRGFVAPRGACVETPLFCLWGFVHL